MMLALLTLIELTGQTLQPQMAFNIAIQQIVKVSNDEIGVKH
jgi:hypothetical protein